MSDFDPGADRAWLATCARGLAPLLCDELQALGATKVHELPSGVSFTGPRAVMYRACLWSRLASRVLMPLTETAAADGDALYAALRGLPWDTLLADGASIAVDFHGTNAEIRDTRFGAQRSKDAVVDVLREAGLPRPRIDPASADLRISVRLRDGVIDAALDMAGESLHRRGYRVGAGVAPLKETLAAALLLRAGWPAMAERGGALIDPLCGSATLLIEGALMAADRAPGLGRERYGFMGWRGHDPRQWQALCADAEGRFQRALEAGMPEIRGYDGNGNVVRRAQENIAAAGLSKYVRVAAKPLREVRKPTHLPLPDGLVICNPPYGERLGDRESLEPLYRELGELMHDQFDGWEAAVLTSDKTLGKALGLRSHRQYAFNNGRIPVHLLLLKLRDNRLRDAVASVPVDTSGSNVETGQEAPERTASAEPIATVGTAGEGAQMFANRLRKNQRRLRRWLSKSGTSCYRLYDADMPEYAVAIDRYEDWLHVAEYRPPKTVDAEAAAQRMADVRAILPEAAGVAAENIVYKSREVKRGKTQYERHATRDEFLHVREGDARLLVNLRDYLDTGLFLDHRPLRFRIGREADGKRFLNLFCYTGTATVHAALGGARHCTSVDMSNTYLRWLRRNLAENGLPESRHAFERADCLRWLLEGDSRYDLIMLDPPSFSNSKTMSDSFDVQRDHPELLTAAMGRLDSAGTLYFSTNRRRFRLDDAVAAQYRVEDITEASLDPDFPRRPPPHRVWQFRHHAD